MKSNAKKTGNSGEKVVADFLKKKGFIISKTNFHSRFGEIDIIAENNEYVLFVEVKTRSRGSIAEPKEFVDALKQNKIISTANYYLMYNPTALQIRFDVAEVIKDENDGLEKLTVNYIKNAFGV